MTEEKITKAALHYANNLEDVKPTNTFNRYLCIALGQSFMEGAKWALNNQWIDATKELPKEEFNDGYTFVFVRVAIDEDTCILETDYIRNGKWELHPDKKITHWMPIPPIEP